jgi:hypothetical protein
VRRDVAIQNLSIGQPRNRPGAEEDLHLPGDRWQLSTRHAALALANSSNFIRLLPCERGTAQKFRGISDDPHAEDLAAKRYCR